MVYLTNETNGQLYSALKMCMYPQSIQPLPSPLPAPCPPFPTSPTHRAPTTLKKTYILNAYTLHLFPVFQLRPPISLKINVIMKLTCYATHTYNHVACAFKTKSYIINIVLLLPKYI